MEQPRRVDKAFVGFMFGASVIASLIGLAVYQVPQPWRGYTILFLLVGVPIMAFVARVMRHRVQMRQADAAKPQKLGHWAPYSRAPKGRGAELNVKFVNESTGKGRLVLK